MATSIISMLSSTMAALTPGKAKFTDISGAMNSQKNVDLSTMSTGQLITFIVVFLLSVWILMFLGEWIYNTNIPKIVPNLGKISTMNFFGIYVLTHILFG